MWNSILIRRILMLSFDFRGLKLQRTLIWLRKGVVDILLVRHLNNYHDSDPRIILRLGEVSCRIIVIIMMTVNFCVWTLVLDSLQLTFILILHF